MDKFANFERQLIRLINAASDPVILQYLILVDNLLDILRVRGLSNTPFYRDARATIPINTEEGFNLNDVHNFRLILQNKFLPGYLSMLREISGITAMANQKTDNWSKFFERPCLTEILSLWFMVDQDIVGDNPQNKIQAYQKVFIYWVPRQSELSPPEKSDYRGSEEMLDINIKNKTANEDSFKRATLIINGVMQSLRQPLGLSILITPAGTWTSHPEGAEHFDLILTQTELKFNPLRYRIYQPHSPYDFDNKNIKIEGGRTVLPRIFTSDKVVKFIGFDRSQVVMIKRNNFGRLPEALQESIYLRCVDYIPEDEK